MIINKNVFDLLQEWYLAQCNGKWEHEFGIEIGTLDNPGWSVTIDLIGTECEKKSFKKIKNLITEHNWIYCIVEEGKFIGDGGPQNLTELIKIFIEWKDS